MEKVSFAELRDNESWEKAVIVFTKKSFSKDFSETERSYEVSRKEKYFDPEMNGSSLFGNCLDGKDDDVRLDVYMSISPEEGKSWDIDYCYITK